jgi:peptidyl-prolyl cis-trans isomerase SurA
MTMILNRFLCSVMLACVSMGSASAYSAGPADYIVAVVNRELVTSAELKQRMIQAREQAQRSGESVPPEPQLRDMLLNALIDERVQLSHAREVGMKVDDNELDRAVANLAAQNQLTLPQLRERLAQDGMEYNRFRSNLREQILLERVRESEVRSRIRVSDAEIDAWLSTQQGAGGRTKDEQYNLAQVFVSVPESASASVLAQRQAKAQTLLERIQAGESFDKVARQLSEDLNKAQGGEIGWRPVDRLPDPFVQAVRDLRPGEVASAVVRTRAGFHVLKLIDKKSAGAVSITQTRVRHILLRPGAKANEEAVLNQMRRLQKQLAQNPAGFEQAAKDASEDGSAAKGGDLGWISPGALVPEFEAAMNALTPNAISQPVVSRFGVHLIQVLERREKQIDAKQLREQAKAALREQKMENSSADWARELRALAYIEMREPPQP